MHPNIMFRRRIIISQAPLHVYLQSEVKCRPSLIPPVIPYQQRNYLNHKPSRSEVISIGASGDITITKRTVQTSSTMMGVPVQTEKLLTLCHNAIPGMNSEHHKGQHGRIGVVGGSSEYTGAPYFAAISALKVGADLVHVFCHQEAAIVIKSYSPELIVHPILNKDDAVEQITPWLQRLHVLVIGPGLGQCPLIRKNVIQLLKVCFSMGKPVIIDADGLSLLVGNLDLIAGQRNVILTPNAIEYQRLFGDRNQADTPPAMKTLGSGVVILEKGAQDCIHVTSGVPPIHEVYIMPAGGSGRRCGGQGDLLCGALAVFFNWCLSSKQVNAAFLAVFAASLLIKECNSEAFKKHGRGMLASDMLLEIPPTFAKIFDSKKS